jgi:hypothetical protein
MKRSDDGEVEVRRKVCPADNEAMRTKKCQTSEGAKEHSHTNSGQRRLAKQRRAGGRGHERERERKVRV